MGQSEEFWDRTAKKFDRKEEKNKEKNTKYHEKINRYLTTDSEVLDIGCGTGRSSLFVAKWAKSVDAIDTSSKMIEIAEEKAMKENVNNVRFLTTSILDKSFDGKKYDVVLGIYVLHLVDEFEATVNRIGELVRLRGKVIIAAPCMKGYSKVMGLILLAGRIMRIFPKVNYFAVDELINRFTQKGFECLEDEILNEQGRQHHIVLQKTKE
jgi:2-polyprenyl-3-methyl-5-hydroxy-6-metoxy-1,4-benzoquinol methylase